MERVAERGKAIATAVEGVEKHWGTSICGPNTLIGTLRERMFRPSLSTIIQENSKVVKVSPADSVLAATKKMLKLKLSSVVVTVENKPWGILTDILMRVIAQNLSPESTLVEKAMTLNPECGTVDTPILDALHSMHDRKILHLPIVDRDGNIVSVVDVIHISQAAIATVGSSTGEGNETANSMMQKFWDSAMSLGPLSDDDDSRSAGSMKVTSEATDATRSAFYPPSGLSTIFGFKLEDKQGRMHRFNCAETQSLTDLISCILQRVGDDINRNLPHILYEDEDHDKIILESDSDLAEALDHARQAGWKSLRLHLDYSGLGHRKKGHGSGGLEYAHNDAWATAYSTIASGVALIACIGVMAYLKRSAS